MSGNYWESTVYAEPPLGGLERCDASTVFDWLGLHFPVVGSKIDWHRVHGRHSHYRVADDAQLVSLVSREVSSRILRGSVVDHVGDGLSPFGVRFASDHAPLVIAELLEIPEHHYFLAGDRSWIVVISTEGDVDIVDQISSE